MTCIVRVWSCDVPRGPSLVEVYLCVLEASLCVACVHLMAMNIIAFTFNVVSSYHGNI